MDTPKIDEQYCPIIIRQLLKRKKNLLFEKEKLSDHNLERIKKKNELTFKRFSYLNFLIHPEILNDIIKLEKPNDPFLIIHLKNGKIKIFNKEKMETITYSGKGKK